MQTGGIAERGAPPSTYCALALVEGQKGAVFRFLGATLGRCFFIAPGLALAGHKGKDLVISTLAASASISTVLMLFYGYQHAKAVSTGQAPPWDGGWNIKVGPAQIAPSAPAATPVTGVRGFRRH